MPAVRAAAAAAPPIVPMNFRRLGNDTGWGSRSTVEGRVSKITGGSVMAGLLFTPPCSLFPTPRLTHGAQFTLKTKKCQGKSMELLDRILIMGEWWPLSHFSQRRMARMRHISGASGYPGSTRTHVRGP